MRDFTDLGYLLLTQIVFVYPYLRRDFFEALTQMLCILDEAKYEILTNLMDLFDERIETGFDQGLHNSIITSKVVTQLKMILYYIHLKEHWRSIRFCHRFQNEI